MAFSNFIPINLPYLYICSNKKPRACNCTYINPYVTIQGLLSPIQMTEGRKTDPRGAGARGPCLGPLGHFLPQSVLG